MLSRNAPGLRLIFRQTHSEIVGDALANQEMDLAVSSGSFGTRGLRQQILGNGTYACLVDRAPRRDSAITVDEYVARGHILVSSGGVVGIVDEGLALLGRRRNVIASTTHFASLPHLLKGTDAIATIPRHAAHAIATLTGLVILPLPISLPSYTVALGRRSSSMRDAAVIEVQSAIVDCFTTLGMS